MANARVVWPLVMSTLVVGSTSAEEPRKSHGERYALLVGVRKYDPNELHSLPYSESDVVDLSKVLLQNGYKRDNVALMTQAAAVEDLRFLPTAERIRKELELLITDCDEEDSVLVAFAGHGVQFQGDPESYFCPADARLADKSTLIALGEIYSALGKCPAGFKVLLVDACRNDPLSNNARSRALINLESVSRPQKKEPPGGVAALFSCSEGEQAFEHESLMHGVFFNYVIEGLSGAAADDDSDGVTLPELELYVKKRVRDFVRSKYGVRQMPELLSKSRGLVPLISFDPALRLFKKGKRLAEAGDDAQATAALNESLRLNPEIASAYYERGRLRNRRGELLAAVDDFNAAINRRLNEPDLFSERGWAYQQTGQNNWAIADFTRTIQAAPNHVKAHIGRAFAYNATGRYDLASQDGQQVDRLDPQKSTQRLTGAWSGVFYYPPADAANRPPVQFQLNMVQYGGQLAANTSEANTLWQTNPRVSANVPYLSGVCKGTYDERSGRLDFIKQYDGTGGADWPVIYGGTLAPGGDRIDGYWIVRQDGRADYSGSFSMTKLAASPLKP